MRREVKCEDCGSLFYTNYVDKKFCDVKCRERTMRKRQKYRVKCLVEGPKEIRLDVHVSVTSPSLALLQHTAVAYQEKIVDKPSLFYGEIPPNWQAPKDITWIPQHDGSWLMNQGMGFEFEDITPNSVQIEPSEKELVPTRTKADLYAAIDRGETVDPDEFLRVL